METNRIKHIEQLIERGHYDEAEEELRETNHPDTPALLRQIHKLRSEQTETGRSLSLATAKPIVQAIVYSVIVTAIITVGLPKLHELFFFLSYPPYMAFVFVATSVSLYRLLSAEGHKISRSARRYRRPGYSRKKRNMYR